MDIFIVPEDCTKLLLIDLPNPKDLTPKSFLCDEDNFALYEIVKYSDNFRSWFVDNLLCKDGHMNLPSRVDPLFIFIPHLMKYAHTQFRSLHDICQEYANQFAQDKKISRLECALKPDIDWKLVCDTKELDDELFVRFSEEKTLDWYVKKHERLCKALENEVEQGTSRATLISYAIDLLDNYIPTCLSDNFKSIVRSKMSNQLTSVAKQKNNGDAKVVKIENGQKHSAKSPSSSEPKPKRTQAPSPTTPKVVPKNSILNFFKKSGS